MDPFFDGLTLGIVIGLLAGGGLGVIAAAVIGGGQ